MCEQSLILNYLGSSLSLSLSLSLSHQTKSFSIYILQLLFHIGYTFLAIVCGSIVCIGVSAVFGVRYGQNSENKIVNKHKNVTMGITCVATGCVTLVVSSVHLIYALKLRQAFLSFRNKIQNVEISYGTTSGL